MAVDHPGIVTAPRLRSTGADQSVALPALVRAGMAANEAGSVIADHDFAAFNRPPAAAPPVTHAATTNDTTIVADSEPAYELTPRDRHRMLADAMKRSSQNVSRDRNIKSLTRDGFSQTEATEALDTIERQLVGKRQAFERARKRAVTFAYLQICASFVFAILGLAGGRVTSLAIFGITAVQGVQRLRAAHRQTFSTFVLTNR